MKLRRLFALLGRLELPGNSRKTAGGLQDLVGGCKWHLRCLRERFHFELRSFELNLNLDWPFFLDQRLDLRKRHVATQL